MSSQAYSTLAAALSRMVGGLASLVYYSSFHFIFHYPQWGYIAIPTIMENQMEKKMENEMEIVISIEGLPTRQASPKLWCKRLTPLPAK